ncbi:MAG: helix-turn-helix domain-containing protein [Pseudomonadota bacterium]
MVKPNAFIEACPSREVLARLGEKWASLIIAGLAEAPLRFTDLSQQIEGISKKMLTQTLRNLERDGFVDRRKIDSERLSQVHYSLTGIGQSVLPIVLNAKQWAEANFSAVVESRDRYDSKHE